jgi:hypothetical protein
LILAERKEAFEGILRQRETDDELLPGKQGSVEETGKSLGQVSFVRNPAIDGRNTWRISILSLSKGMNRWMRRRMHLFDI